MQGTARLPVPDQDELIVPNVDIDPAFLDYWRGGVTPQTENLYGEHNDHNWEFKDGEYEDMGMQDMAIKGVANWTDVWENWDDVGDDFTLVGTDDEPLSAAQIDMMNDHCSIRVTSFDRLIAIGGFGRVYQVKYQQKFANISQQTGTGRGRGTGTVQVTYTWGPTRVAACKLLRLQEEDSFNLEDLGVKVKEILHDFLALRYLKHPNIVQLLDVVHIPDTQTRFPMSTVLLLMELCDRDLNDVSNECYNYIIPLVVVKKMLRDICAALKYMHSKNMTHMDIKPPNVLFKWAARGRRLTEANLLKYYPTITFKLADLGMCQSFDHGQPDVTRTVAGTENYMSPEMKALKRNAIYEIAAKPCDIYSLGLTLAFCVMPSLDFDDYIRDNNLFQYIDQIIRTDVYPQGMSQTVAHFIHSMIEEDPDLRPTVDDLWRRVESWDRLLRYWRGPVKSKRDRLLWHSFNKK